MIKKVIIYGASNSGDEFVQLFRDINKDPEGVVKWDIIGFLDDNQDVIGKVRNGIPVLGNREWVKEKHKENFNYVCCIGDPKTKRSIVDYLEGFNVSFATAIHPSVVISESSEVGVGSLICAGCIITTNVKIGRHVMLNLMCSISHNSVIGDYCTINPGVKITGDITIEEEVYIGTNSAILPRLNIGKGSIIGGGALVHLNVPSSVTVVGVPAKVIKIH